MERCVIVQTSVECLPLESRYGSINIDAAYCMFGRRQGRDRRDRRQSDNNATAPRLTQQFASVTFGCVVGSRLAVW